MLKFHHIGCLVQSINDAKPLYEKLYQSDEASDIINISQQGVNVCFIPMPGGGFIELVEPSGENSIVNGMIRKGFTYYHIGYLVNDITKAISDLENDNYKCLQIFNSEAFAGKKCAFLYSPEMHMIELIES